MEIFEAYSLLPPDPVHPATCQPIAIATCIFLVTEMTSPV